MKNKRNLFEISITFSAIVTYAIISLFTTTIGFLWNRFLIHVWPHIWKKKKPPDAV